MSAVSTKDFNRALEIGRPPNIVKLFPNSRALLVSGKAIDRAMIAKGRAMTIAANGRNQFVIRGVLRAAQRANAAIILEIAKSEGGVSAYCDVSFWNLARVADSLANEMGITVPVAIHADHYGIKNDVDVAAARVEIPTLFGAGITSIAIDASHLQDDRNLLAGIELAGYVPGWAGLETEVGEIKGKEGLSTEAEALFLIRGLNAHGIFPDWIALNNGTTHGIEQSDAGIQVGLTTRIHAALKPYMVSGAQHGTSGNSSDRLRKIVGETFTTKANVATALQMVSWGVRVNDYGNAFLDDDGEFAKVSGDGVSDELWAKMVAYAKENGIRGVNYKKLNRPFENHLLSQPAEIRERSVQAVEDFAYHLLKDVFNAVDTAPLAIRSILQAGSFDLGPKVGRIEDPEQWTEKQIIKMAGEINTDRGQGGDFDD